MVRRHKNDSGKVDHGTYVTRRLLEEPAWREISCTAQMAYVWLRLEWKGTNFNNNGRIRLSVRQLAARLGVSPNTAAGVLHELQEKGFIYVTEMGALGVAGEARGPSYDLTELPSPTPSPASRKLYELWKPGHDFRVAKHAANNPNGRNGKQSAHLRDEDVPVLESETLAQNPILEDDTGRPNIVTFRRENRGPSSSK